MKFGFSRDFREINFQPEWLALDESILTRNKWKKFSTRSEYLDAEYGFSNWRYIFVIDNQIVEEEVLIEKLVKSFNSFFAEGDENRKNEFLNEIGLFSQLETKKKKELDKIRSFVISITAKALMMTFQRNSNEISGDQIYQIIENRGELLYHIPYIKELEISKTTERKNLWDENSIEAFFRNNLVIQVKTKILEKLGNAIGIFLRKDLNLGKGKSGAQLSHGAISLLYQPTFKTGALDHYLADNDKKILLFTIKDLKNLLEIQDLCRKNNVNYSLIQDAGHTQIEAGTATCIAIGPIPIIWIQILAFNLEAKELT